ncbi:MAG: AraC family transcriptional regulator [Acidobacteria bacterium]|nr:MAG: AraC family transcriptional regulator [Acidobacteriota bacterium]REK01265.1 MAG: AraC family transcriptional regulator [Acidobacteriota bacterium]REK14221.1 MAG: AraC family transcriptional regulator [Acidobacteriota bacterium]REK44936.1 MAG: AraC family transcriptional regulator [Acidobacteriota bacterium]
MDVLSDILRSVHIQGSLYFRTAFNAPWGVSVPRYSNVSRYHLVTRGSCWATVEGHDEKIKLEKGDLIFVTNGASHDLFCGASDPPFLPVDAVVQESGFDGTGALVWGGDKDGETTALVCGHFEFDHERGKMLLSELPPYIHIPNTEIMHYKWLEEAMRFITHEAFEREPGSEAVINRLAEIIFIQSIRTYAKRSSDASRLFSALRDEQLGRVFEAIHEAPEENWTVESMAKAGGMSRTAISQRMNEVLSVTPMAYLTQWRMELAHEALLSTREGIPEIAESVGYQSLSAFTRAFKKHFGRGPGEVRRKGPAG